MHRISTLAVALAALLYLSSAALADIKVKQRVTMSGQKIESTRLIKGSRERTEQNVDMGPDNAAFIPQIATITQCDLKRTVRLNDRKQLYMVEPFRTAADPTPVRRETPQPDRTTVTRQGGTMTMTSNIRDTGERKMMFGLQARHLIITQEMESSADSCNGPNKSKMEFDGWYVDFSAEFNCPQATPEIPAAGGHYKPDCIDKIIYKGSGAARLGFLLEGTMKMYGSDGTVQMTQTTETLELSRSPLDASLFDIPQGYREAANQQDLYAMPNMGEILARETNNRNNADNTNNRLPANDRRQSVQPLKSVAISVNFAPGVTADQAAINEYVRSKVAGRRLNAVSYGAADYTLSIDVKQFKESAAGKIGGIFGKVTGVDTRMGKVDVDITASLSGTGISPAQSKVKSKFDGPASSAIRVAIDQALDQLLNNIGN